MADESKETKTIEQEIEEVAREAQEKLDELLEQYADTLAAVTRLAAVHSATLGHLVLKEAAKRSIQALSEGKSMAEANEVLHDALALIAENAFQWGTVVGRLAAVRALLPIMLVEKQKGQTVESNAFNVIIPHIASAA